jgi:hypothetical protein
MPTDAATPTALFIAVSLALLFQLHSTIQQHYYYGSSLHRCSTAQSIKVSFLRRSAAKATNPESSERGYSDANDRLSR